jgi:glycosyltransferase involved in cell wall biosynthesis
MHILFLSQLLPYPPDAGAKVRSYYTLRWLAHRHMVTLVTFTRNDDPRQAVEHLRQFCHTVYTIPLKRSPWRDVLSLVGSLLKGRSFIIFRDRSPAMDALLQGLLRQEHFDALHADQLWMAQFALRCTTNVPTSQSSNPQRLVLDEHNACFQIFERLAHRENNLLKRWLWRREAKLLRQYEAHACSRFDRVVTVTKEDRMLLEGLSRQVMGSTPLFTTIPICVDPREKTPVKLVGDGQNVLLLGTMFWPPNVEGLLWFARQVWPRVVGGNPGARLSIVGKSPPRQIQALTASGSIEVPGYVADPLLWLERAGVFIVPLLSGGGMRVKIVDAWRWGLPVVSTTIGAEGISYKDGDNILIADSADDFAAAIGRILHDPDLAQRLRENGRRWVEQHYDWQAVYPAWGEVFES